jgi:cell division septal protein FtsQ
LPEHALALWIATFLCILVVGLLRSPLTKLSVVRVSGAAEASRAEIRRKLETIADSPWGEVSARKVERMFELDPTVKRATFRANLFGRGRLKLTQRKPVAKLQDGNVIDETGQAFSVRDDSLLNLQISAKVEDFSTILTITDPSPLTRLARVAKKIQDLLPKLAGSLYFDVREGISLRSEGLVVEFGDTSNLDRKVQVLAAKLGEDPKLPSRGGRIVVVDPENAVQAR